MLNFDFFLNLLLLCLDLALKREGLLLELVLFELEKSLLLGGLQQLLLNLFNLVLNILLVNFDVLDALVNIILLTIDTILVRLMIITLLSQLLPGRLGLLSDNFGAIELRAHLGYLNFKLSILIVDIGDQTNTDVLESALLLKLEPLLLELVHSLRHGALGQEVADEVIDYDRTLDRVGIC